MKMMIEEEENNDSNNNHNLVVLDKLAGMFHQEESDGYKVPPFLEKLDNNDLQYHHHRHHYCPPSPLTSSSSSSQQPPVDILARQSIAKWCYKIMSILKYSSETAEIAMSCLDRFVSSSSSSPFGQYCLMDRHQYRLAALTCVYTISKVHESTALSIGFVIKLSSNANADPATSPPPFTRKQIESMEIQILMGLQFRINPITTIEYVHSYLNLLPQSSMGYETRRVLIELCQYQITRSVVEYKFCIEKKSMIGFASLLNAIDSIYKDDGRTAWDVESMITHYVPNLVVMSDTLQRLRSMLYETVASDDNLETSSKLLLLQGCSYYHQVASSTTSTTSSRTRTSGTPPPSSSSSPPTEITITNHRRSDVDDDNNDNNKSKSSSSKGPGLSNSPRSATYMM